MTPQILLLEDEIDFQEVLSEILCLQGYEVISFQTVAAFNKWYRPDCFNLAILDRTLPDGDGLDVLKRIRMDSATPVILLTGMSQSVEKIRGLDADADHYLTKPVDMKELLAIVRQLLRRSMPHGNNQNKAWRVDINAWRLISPSGLEAALTHRECVLLKCFIDQSGKVVQRDGIVEAMGFNPMVYDMRRLETMVSRLRKKIEAADMEEFPLQTVYGVGYALHADLISD
jgi:DNA-binding response OmpR family regulator